MRPRSRHQFRRLAHLSFKNIGRNLFLSLSTTIMMGLILFIFNIILVLNVLTQSSLDQLGEKVDLIIYLDDDISLYEANELLEEVESIPVVKEVSYTSKAEALQGFLHLNPEQTEFFSSYGLDNPLPGSLQILTNSPDQHEMVLDYLMQSSYAPLLTDVESSEENKAIVDRLLSITDFTKKLIVGVTVTFVFGALIMIMNAIHLSIFTRKTEIQIMQLVGAKPNMIRFPFLFEGTIYSFIAVFFSLILLIAFVEGTQLSELSSFQTQFNPVLLFGIELGASLVIGFLSSFIALSYYLKRTLILQK